MATQDEDPAVPPAPREDEHEPWRPSFVRRRRPRRRRDAEDKGADRGADKGKNPYWLSASDRASD
jgi:hypothetical protein